MSNVIDFTKFKVDKEIERFDQLVEESQAIDDFSADFAFSVAADIVEALSELDYDVMDNPKCLLDILSMIEAIRAIVFRITGQDYAFHAVSNSLFESLFEEAGGDYRKALSNFLEEIVD